MFSLFFFLFLMYYGYYRIDSYLIPKSYFTSSFSQVKAQKYDPAAFVKVIVSKPLGISLEEVEENKNNGVFICELDDGSIQQTQKVKMGDYLIEVNGIDVREKDFDSIIDMLIAIPDDKPLELVFIDPKSIFKGTAILNVKTPTGDKVIRSLKGLNMRRVLLDNGIDVYGMKGSVVNCGGGGSCGTCVVNVKDNLYWEKRPAFESSRLKKYDSTAARLSCNTIIEGDCTIEIQPPKVSSQS